MKRLPLAMLVGVVVLATLLYIPFVPQVSLDLRTTTATSTRSSVVATETYQTWFTATVLWTTVTMQVGGQTATIPMPYTVVASDVVKTYTSRTTSVWTEVATVTYSSSRTRYEALAGMHPFLFFLLILVFVIIPVACALKMLGENTT